MIKNFNNKSYVKNLLCNIYKNILLKTIHKTAGLFRSLYINIINFYNNLIFTFKILIFKLKKPQLISLP